MSTKRNQENYNSNSICLVSLIVLLAAVSLRDKASGGTNDTIIFPNSDMELISETEAEKLSVDETRLAMAEIYARYGQVFDDEKITDHVRSVIPDYDTYVAESGDDYFSIYDLNEIEMTNIKTLEATYDGYQDPSLSVLDLNDENVISSLDEIYAIH